MSGDIKADDEGEYHSDTDKEKNLKVEISEDAKFSLKQLKEEKTLKRERVDLENDNKHAKENDEPNSKKRALEHLRNMNFNKKDPFNQLGYFNYSLFNRYIILIICFLIDVRIFYYILNAKTCQILLRFLGIFFYKNGFNYLEKRDNNVFFLNQCFVCNCIFKNFLIYIEISNLFLQ